MVAGSELRCGVGGEVVVSLDPLRYEEPLTDVKLSSELTGSLRQLQVQTTVYSVHVCEECVHVCEECVHVCEECVHVCEECVYVCVSVCRPM